MRKTIIDLDKIKNSSIEDLPTAFPQFHKDLIKYLEANPKLSDRETLRIRHIYQSILGNSHTCDVKMCDLRKYMHATKKHLFQFDRRRKNKLVRDSKESVLKRNRERLEISEQQIDEWIGECLESENENITYVGLMLCSGCRFSEIQSSQFKAVDNRYIKQKGVLKKENGENFEIIKPSLCDTSLWLKKYNTIKGKAFNNTTINRKIKEIFGESYNSHMMRKIYANVSYKWFNVENENLQTFIMRILGHSGVMTSLYYSGINITD